MPAIGDALKRLEASASDETAWRVLYSELWPRLFGTSFRILGGVRHLAEDATQETFIKLFRKAKISEFVDKPEAFISYALAICRNTSLNYRTQLLRFQEVDSSAEQAESIKAPGENPELQIILARRILQLGQPYRELLDLLLEGNSIVEIAKKLGISYSATAVRIHRLRNELTKG